MKKIQVFFCITFFVLLLVPVVTFNRKENVASKTDNRMLMNNPFGPNYAAEQHVDLTADLDSYVQDRIGFRDEMIYGYTLLHDKLFHQLVSPIYMYGKDGQVFSSPGLNRGLEDYHIAFADMLKEIQEYCEARNTPFLFVIEPEKASLLRSELAPGIHYDDSWVQEFEEELDARGVHYTDNFDVLAEKIADGEEVFNKKYNAGHWNELGAFYGVNHILETMKADNPSIHINQKEEFDITQQLQTSLMVSKFPIHEYEPVYSRRCEVQERTQEYKPELKISENYGHFSYTVNAMREGDNPPRTLVFQGSYINELASQFFENSLGEYIAVHNYENVMNFDYYYNIFQPEYVVFEAAEYVFTDQYFTYEGMEAMKLNPPLQRFENMPEESHDFQELNLEVKEGASLTTITVDNLPDNVEYAYLRLGEDIFDFGMTDANASCYEVTIKKEKYNSGMAVVEAVTADQKKRVVYH